MSADHSFDLIHGRGAFRRLRLRLADPSFTYQQIGSEFGLTRQRIAQIADELGINARRRVRERVLRREPSVIKKDYPPDVLAVIGEIRRSGLEVRPHLSFLSCRPNLARRSQTMVQVVALDIFPVSDLSWRP